MSTTQLDLLDWAFDPARGEAAKNDAMARADEAADPDWQVFMLAAVTEVARRQSHLTTDDIERLRLERNGPETHEKRALGPLMMRAKKAGVCEPTDDFERSVRPINHRRPMRVWRSLIFAGETAWTGAK